MRLMICLLLFAAGFIAGVNMPPQPDYTPELWRVFASIVFTILLTVLILRGNCNEQ